MLQPWQHPMPVAVGVSLYPAHCLSETEPCLPILCVFLFTPGSLGSGRDTSECCEKERNAQIHMVCPGQRVYKEILDWGILPKKLHSS